MIDELPLLTPDLTRGRRALACCREALERRKAEAEASRSYTLERNALIGFGAVYLSSVAFDTLTTLIG
jgi:hypothetical protein